MKINQQITLSRRLGIDVWGARKPLLGASPAHRVFGITKHVDTQALDATRQVSAATSAMQNRSKKSPQNRAAELSHSLDISARPLQQPASHFKTVRAAVESPANLKQNKFVSSQQEFSLVAVVSGDILLVDEVSNLQLTASTYTQWLNALLVSLAAEPLQAPLASQDRISWPLSPHANKNDANEMVSAWLKKKLAIPALPNQPRRVLIMGTQSAALLASGIDVGALTTIASLNSLPALVTFGTKQLWAKPLAKKLFWQHLQLLNE